MIRGVKIIEFKTKYSNSVKHLVDILDWKPKQSWLGRRHNSTLDWLMSGSWHHVEGLKTIYDNSEEYAEFLLKLWTLLTFYWGSEAVWARCTQKQCDSQEGNTSGEPISISGTCKRRRCNSNAEWRCFRKNHDAIQLFLRTCFCAVLNCTLIKL